MNLYALTLQPPSLISHAIAGNFSDAKSHEFAVVRGQGHLEILQRDDNNGQQQLRVAYREQAFCNIRQIASLRLNGHRTDLLVLCSDSGRLSILRLRPDLTGFDRLYCESFGKTGLRRTVPGQYLAVDPQGRCLMIAALEKDKLVFGTNRDSEDKLFVASPLEAHRANTICFALVALDVGFENPLFAAIEASYQAEGGGSGGGKKHLVLYEVDLGLNHVVRKSQRLVQDTANHLIPLPQGQGVYVCSELGMELFPIKPSEGAVVNAVVRVPRRELDAAEAAPVLVTCSTTFQNKDVFFALLQTERGDLFKLERGELTYLDTIRPSNQVCLSKNGLLFCASEFGNHDLFELAGMEGDVIAAAGAADSFSPSTALRNLERVSELDSCAPITQFKVADLAKDAGVAQVYALCGRGNHSTLRVLRQGLQVSERGIIRFPVSKSETVRGLFCVREAAKDAGVAHLVLSFQDTTRVFTVKQERISETQTREVLEEDLGSRFTRDAGTMCAGNWTEAGGDMIQVTSTGWRRVAISTGQVLDRFQLPLGSQKKIDKASIALGKLCFVLTGGELVYIEADARGVPQERARMDVGLDVECVDCETQLLAVGCWDNSVRVYSLPGLTPLSSQKFPARPHSLALIRESSSMRLEVGLVNGILVRSQLDLGMSGAIVDSRMHVLGNKPVRVHAVTVRGRRGEEKRAALCCSSRAWLAAGAGGETSPCPLSYRACEFAAQYSLGNNADGLVLVGPKNVLSLASLDGLGDYALPRFNHESFALDRTPRRLVKHPKSEAFIVIEGDADTFPSVPMSASAKLPAVAAAAAPSSSSEANKRAKSATTTMQQADSNDMDVEEEEDGTGTHNGAALAASKEDAIVDPELAPHHRIGYAKQAKPMWSSCIRVFAPFTGNTTQRIQLDLDEMAVSIEHCRIQSEDYIFVGTVSSLQFHPTRTFASCAIRTYRIAPNNRLEFFHRTTLSEIPSALCFFDGRLLCGSGNGLTLYELGKQQLLRKAEARNLPSLVAFIKPVGADRLVVGDAQDSVLFLSYSKQENSFFVFADDVFNRMSTVGEMVDANTCALGDKFGGIAVLRLPVGATGMDPKSRAAQARNALWEAGGGGGALSAPHKLDIVAQYYVGEVVTALQRVTLAPGRAELLLYGTVCGTLGALTPFASREDLAFFSKLELAMRKHWRGGLAGRDHLQFRSYFAPVKHVVDGDLCEYFVHLPPAAQQDVAREMDCGVGEITRRLEEQRWQVMW